jgi:hypothetical protein
MFSNNALVLSSIIICAGFLGSSYISNNKNSNIIDNENITAIDKNTLINLEENINTLNQTIERLNNSLQYNAQLFNPQLSEDNSSPEVHKYLSDTIGQAVKSSMAKHQIGSTTNSEYNEDITPEQMQAYNDFSAQLDDPHFTDSLHFDSLTSNNEMKNLPMSLQNKIMGKVVTMLNNGEINEATFVGGAQ